MKKTISSLFLTALLTMCTLQLSSQTFLFIGDSITDGNWGSRDGRSSNERVHDDYNHIFGHGYMEMTAGYFMSEYPDLNLKFYNRGISGHRLPDLVNRWQEDAIALQPDVISILIGTNDVHHHLDHPEFPFSVAGFETQLDSLITATTRTLPNVRFVLCTPFVTKSGWVGKTESYPERERLVKEIATAMRKVATKHNLPIVPFDKLFSTLVSGTDTPEYWMWDGIHPTTAAHYKMSRLWIDTMESRLGLNK